MHKECTLSSQSNLLASNFHSAQSIVQIIELVQNFPMEKGWVDLYKCFGILEQIMPSQSGNSYALGTKLQYANYCGMCVIKNTEMGQAIHFGWSIKYCGMGQSTNSGIFDGQENTKSCKLLSEGGYPRVGPVVYGAFLNKQ